ncbi:MAG: hypothetical protein JWM98_70, partial [Thermoleophilia bacterium]|nr:hypothetical protein [Thermoleophilia bacterium]
VVFDAVAGTTYYFQADAVDASNLGAFTFRVNRTFTNDTFASAWDLGTSSGRYLVTDNVAASKQAGEPAHGGNAGGASVWFKWTAPSSATVTFDTTAAITRTNTLLAAYTGAAVGSLTLVAGNDDVGGGTSSRISFAATAGTTYRIAVDGKAGATGVSELRWYVGTRPANDDFASATSLAGATVSTTGDTTMASFEGSEPQPSFCVACAEASVWYSWTAPSSGWFTVDTFGGPVWDNAIQVYTGASVGSLVPVVADDDSCNGTWGQTDGLAQTGWSATSGTTYRIRVYSFWDRDPGQPFNLNIRTAPPANNTFASPVNLPGASYDSPCWHNFGATKQAGEPLHGGLTGGASMWYTWTAPSSGVASINLLGAEFDTLLGVYTGGAVNALTLVAGNDDFYGYTSRVTFNAVAGTTYRVAVDGWDGTTVQMGNYRVHVNDAPDSPTTRDGPVQGNDDAWLTTPTSIAGNWDAVTNEPVTSYDWCVQTTPDTTCTSAPLATGTTTTATSFLKTGLALTQGVAYYVCVQAHTDFNLSGYECSDGQTLDSVAPTPNPSTGSGVANSTSQITWTATAATDAVSGLDPSAYSFDNGATWQSSNVLVRTGLSAATAYSVTIRVRDVAGNLSTGATITRSTWAAPPTAPTAAGGWSVADANNVALGWTAPAGGATSYRVRWSVDAYASVQGSVATTGYIKPALTANTAYLFKVCSVNADGVEETTCTAPFGATTPPAPPSAIASSNVTSSQADFTWTTAPGATSTELRTFTDATCTTVATTNAGISSPFTRAGLALDRAYWYQLRSFSTASASWGAPSACTALSTSNGRTAMTIAVDSASVALGTVLPGATATGSTTITTQTYGATGYQLLASAALPTNGATTIPGTTSGTVGSPAGASAGAWSGTGFGFTVATGTNVEAGWSAGTKWARFNTAPETIHATGAAFTANTSNTSTTRVDYRLSVPLSQAPGAYSTTVTYTAVATP